MRFLARNQETDLQVWPSYTDVALNIILILLFYLFMQVVISSQTSAAMMEIRQRQAELKTAVMNALPKNLGQDVVKISEDGNLQRFSFSDRILFASGEAELKPLGVEALSAFGGVLREKVGTFSRIQIEGHTDTIPINSGRYPSNWELSSARATSVVRFMQDGALLDPRLLSATGYSQFQPVDKAENDSARAFNRRVEVVVVYSVHKASDQSSASAIGQ